MNGIDVNNSNNENAKKPISYPFRQKLNRPNHKQILSELKSNDGDEFLSPDNMCGAALLRLTSRGSALITDLMELAKFIPPVFHLAAKEAILEEYRQKRAASKGFFGWFNNQMNMDNDEDSLYPYSTSLTNNVGIASTSDKNNSGSREPQYDEGATNKNAIGGFLINDKKYCALLFDFTYLNAPEEYERRINDIPDNVELEAAFAASHRDILVQFYNLFESLYQYQKDLNQFSNDLDQGYYIQYTLDSVLLDKHGQQLIGEAISFYGLLLLLLDRFIPGPVRERLIIAFFRYCGKDGTLANIDEVCKLCGSTGYMYSPTSRKQMKPPKYEEKFFARFPLSKDLVRNVIGRILSDDIYMQASAFPNYNHRSSRLSKQASILYIILFFQPQILHAEMGVMREIVDKFFFDNWIISIYMGITIDLKEEWLEYKAATAALDNVIILSNVKRFHESNVKTMNQCLVQLDKYLSNETLTDQYVLDHTNELLNFMRQCNVAIRWRILHRLVDDKQFSNIISPQNGNTESSQKNKSEISAIIEHESLLVSLLLQSSRFDMILKETFSRLLATKAEKWSDLRHRAEQRMTELSDYFTGEQALTRVSRDDNMTQWFADMAKEIKCLSYGEEHSTVTGQKIQHYVQTLDDLEQYDIIDRNFQVKVFLNDTKDLLLQMVRAVSIKEDMINIVESVSDMSCVWEVIHDYIDGIHEYVRNDPYKAISLRALFLKLSHALETPIFRMKQINSASITKTKDFYTQKLKTFIKKVLEVIPKSLFGILLEIVEIKEQSLRQIPTKIQVDSLKDFSQFNQRIQLAKLTHTASFFTEGISILDNTHLNFDHQQLLDECLRKELVRVVSIIMHLGLSFDVPNDSDDSTLLKFRKSNLKSFRMVANRIDGIRRAVESIQDYIGVSLVRIWGEEYSRIMHFYTEQETRRYTGEKTINKYQSKSVPIPRFAPTTNDPQCVSFIGRTLLTLLRMTDSQITIYSQACNGWFLDSGQEMCGVTTFTMLRGAIGVSGLSGLDQLLSFRIKYELERYFKFYGTTMKKSAVLIEQIRELLFPEWKTPKDPRFYSAAVKRMEKFFVPTGTCLRRMGQAQLLRKMIRTELKQSSRINVNVYHQSISSLNSSLLSEMNSVYKDSQFQDIPEIYRQISINTCNFLNCCGEGDPLQNIFVKADPLDGLPVVIFLFIISMIPKLEFDPDFSALVRTNEDITLDGWPVIVGIQTLMKQFHPSYAKSLLAYLAQFIRATIEHSSSSRDSIKNDTTTAIPLVVKKTMIFTSQLCSIGNVPNSILHSYIPQYLMEMCS